MMSYEHELHFQKEKVVLTAYAQRWIQRACLGFSRIPFCHKILFPWEILEKNDFGTPHLPKIFTPLPLYLILLFNESVLLLVNVFVYKIAG